MDMLYMLIETRLLMKIIILFTFLGEILPHQNLLNIYQKTRDNCLKANLLEEKAFLVCSEKLTEKRWEEIPLKTLFIVRSNLAVKKEQL